VNEAGCKQFGLRALDYISRGPATRSEEGSRSEQSTVVVANVLTRELQQQRSRGMAQSGVCVAIEHGPGESNKPSLS
jgi:hypothetical protein